MQSPGHTCIRETPRSDLAVDHHDLTRLGIRNQRTLDGFAVDREPRCRAAFEAFLDDFGRSLGGVISILDPDAVVLGGGLSNIDELYAEGAERTRHYAFHNRLRTPILKNRMGDSAGVFGAAWIGLGDNVKVPSRG